jgi:hypothetical protein
MLKQEKLLQSLARYQQILESNHNDQMAFYLAICHICLGNFNEGQKQFEKSCLAMFSPPMLWKMSAHPDWLVDICILAGRTDLFPIMFRELESFQIGATGNSLRAFYAYGMIGLLSTSRNVISKWIRGLSEKPKIVMWFSIGQALQAILEKENDKFNTALATVLKAHEGQAIRGGLRSTPEGFLCMPAMSLCYVAFTHDLNVTIDNEYLSNGYINFLKTRAR